jgi:hypothetical protein
MLHRAIHTTSPAGGETGMRGMTGAMRRFDRLTRVRRMGMLIGAALLAAACRDRAPQAAQEPVRVDSVPQRVDVRLYVARDWAWNEEDTLRVTVVNATEQPLSGDLNLFVGAPVELLADSAGARSNSAPPPRTTQSGEGTRVVFPIGTLVPGASGEFRQAVRTPPAPDRRPSNTKRDTTSRFAVRAWVSGAEGAEVAAAQDTIRIRAGSEVVAGGCAGLTDVSVTRYGVGPLRLDMQAADVRSLCPEARDTTWRGAEGTAERGLLVRLAGKRVLVELDGQTVHRIVTDTAGLRTGAGVGVGSTLADLRGRYGRMCADEAEGKVAVWSPAAPGISFGLRTEDTGEWAVESRDAGLLPDTARVDQMWVRKGTDDCPRGEPT